MIDFNLPVLIHNIDNKAYIGAFLTPELLLELFLCVADNANGVFIWRICCKSWQYGLSLTVPHSIGETVL